MTTSYQVMTQDGDYIEHAPSVVAHTKKQPITFALNDINIEVADAMQKHGPLKSFHEAYSVIKEEFEEFWDEVKVNPRKLSPEEQGVRLRHMREELIQVAAMCVRTIADLEL